MGRVPTSEELIDSFDQGTLAREMAHRFRLKDEAEIKLVEARCADLHNKGTLDLLRLAENDGIPGLKATDFFMATHFFCRILFFQSWRRHRPG
jgi:hypothetical protein